MSEGLNPSTNDASMVFLHELMHTEYGRGLTDPPKGSYGEIGEAEDIINTIREQLGSDFGKRYSYAAKEVTSGIYIPFDENSRYDLKQGLTPREGSLYIQIYTKYKSR